MPLQKQVVNVPFRGGVDSKTDSKQIAPPKLEKLENAVFDSLGRIEKRDGIGNGFSQTIIGGPDDGNDMTDAYALAAFRNETVMIGDGPKGLGSSGVYSKTTDDGSGWIYKGPFTPAKATATPVIRNASSQHDGDMAVSPGGIECYAWEGRIGAMTGMFYSIRDSTQTLLPPTLLLSSAVKAKVLCNATEFCVFFYNNNTQQIDVATIPFSNPRAAPTITQVSIGTNDITTPNTTSPNFDVCVFQGLVKQFAVTYYNNVAVTPGPVTQVQSYASPATNITSDAPVSDTVVCINVFADPFALGPVIVYYNGTVLKYRAYDRNLNTLSAATADTIQNVVLVSGVAVSSSGVGWQIYYTTSASHARDYIVNVVKYGSAYARTAPRAFAQHLCQAAKTFAIGTHGYTVLVYDEAAFDADQNTYFVVDDALNVVARIVPRQGGPLPARTTLGAANLPETISNATSFVRFVVPYTDLITADNGGFDSITGITSLDVLFGASAGYVPRATLADTLHVGGAAPFMYDGQNVVEHGFNLYPSARGISIVGNSGMAGGLEAGTRSYVAIYEWTDANGQIHRSGVSAPVQKTNSLHDTNDVTIPFLPLTGKTAANGSSPPVVRLYRTIAGGTIYYNVCTGVAASTPTTNAPAFNDVTTLNCAITDAMDDTTAQGNNQLYTTGGTFPNGATNPLGPMIVYADRIFAIDTTNPLTIWYSQQVAAGEPVQFSPSLTMQVDSAGGDTTALGSLDEKLIVFKGDRIFYVTGTGPSPNGATGEFSDTIPTPGSIGCSSQSSILTTPIGLMFESPKGIRLLDRSLGTSYIGADVEAYNTLFPVVAAMNAPTTNQTRFALASTDNDGNGICLCFDTLVNQWSVFTYEPGTLVPLDAAVTASGISYVTNAGIAYTETPGVFLDQGDYVSMHVLTGWYSFAGLQGFKSVLKVILLGEQFSATTHQATVDVVLSYDFGATSQALTAALPISLPSQAILFPSTQRCESIRVELTDNGSVLYAEGQAWSGLAFEFGLQKGAVRLPSAQSFG